MVNAKIIDQMVFISVVYLDIYKAYNSKVKLIKRPFPSSPGPLFQNEGRFSAFDMEIIFHSHANKTRIHKKGCAPSLILKVRVFATRKWPIVLLLFSFLYTERPESY